MGVVLQVVLVLALLPSPLLSFLALEHALLFTRHWSGQPAALKVATFKSGIDEMENEVLVYQHLRDLQGKAIPHLLWHGFCDEASYGIATTHCVPDPSYTKKEKQVILEALRRKGVVHGDVRRENFVRSAEGRLLAIDFGRSEVCAK